jgi:hypothetical protein
VNFKPFRLGPTPNSLLIYYRNQRADMVDESFVLHFVDAEEKSSVAAKDEINFGGE